MFSSLIEWANIPIQIRPHASTSGTGGKQYGPVYDVSCYIENEVKTVVDNKGRDIISNTQFYVDGNVDVTSLDNILFDGVENEVKAIQTFYRDGVPNIKVVYV